MTITYPLNVHQTFMGCVLIQNGLIWSVNIACLIPLPRRLNNHCNNSGSHSMKHRRTAAGYCVICHIPRFVHHYRITWVIYALLTYHQWQISLHLNGILIKDLGDFYWSLFSWCVLALIPSLYGNWSLSTI